jgi:GntR family transcriptional repressor for pyruvate dehydrogenase complex
VTLGPIQTSKTYEAVTERLKEAILQGTFPPGSRLPSVRQLSQQFSVGQAAVREALSALRAMNLVTVRQGEGTFVNRFDPDALAKQVAGLGVLTAHEIRHLLELRQIIEGGTARLAAARRNEADLTRLDEAIAHMQDDVTTGSIGEAADWEFHHAIAAASGNPMLLSMLDTIAEKIQTQLFASRQHLFQIHGEPERLLQQHRGIAEAIRARDGDLAEERMRAHLMHVEEMLQEGHD